MAKRTVHIQTLSRLRLCVDMSPRDIVHVEAELGTILLALEKRLLLPERISCSWYMSGWAGNEQWLSSPEQAETASLKPCDVQRDVLPALQGQATMGRRLKFN